MKRFATLALCSYLDFDEILHEHGTTIVIAGSIDHLPINPQAKWPDDYPVHDIPSPAMEGYPERGPDSWHELPHVIRPIICKSRSVD